MRLFAAILIAIALFVATKVRSTETDDLSGHDLWTVEKGASETDESWPTYELARKHCDIVGPSGEKWEQGRFKHWDEIENLGHPECYAMGCESKAYQKAANAQTSCDVARFQACAGLDRKSWNLHWKPKFRQGLRNNCY